MANLTTQYMGLKLDSPIIAGSSGMTDKPEKIKKLAEAGAGAVVLKSLFEEQINMEVDSQAVNNMYGNYDDVENYVSFYTRKHNLDAYLKLIKDTKAAVDIPVIASINCISAGEWTDFAKKIENAGADGLELNIFVLPSDPEQEADKLVKNYHQIVQEVSNACDLPLAVKTSYYFTSLSRRMVKLSNEPQVKALVLFNRFYNPDVDLDKEEVKSGHIYSVPEENAMCLRWVGALYGKVGSDLAASHGIHDGEAVLKNLLIGASAVQIASVLYKEGPDEIKSMLNTINAWMDKKGYEKLADIIGKLAQSNIKRPMIYERAQFMKYYSEHR
ncbi:MAG: dihydroorotate dehydrogenase-like protein [Candidatus Delongbacteria bacterium]|jgi:dihydroorotate dehydrogenase (fumarate)|nr:dihydroorotate dehydrogenase-like protein [Candidatus Delongbacteria bacterium]